MSEKLTVMISGGSSGIGKALAKEYAAGGHDVVIGARRPDVLLAARDEIESARRDHSQRVTALRLDVSDERSVDAFVRTALAEHGKVDILVNSAGIAVCKELADTSSAEFMSAMLVNYFGTALLANRVIPHMREAGRGHVVNISSMAGAMGVYGYAAYTPSKFAVVGYTEVLRSELLRDGIGVTLVLPPDTETPQLYMENMTKPEITKSISGTIKPMMADQVAREIVRGVRRRKFLVIPGLASRLLYRLNKVCPAVIYGMMKGKIRKGT